MDQLTERASIARLKTGDVTALTSLVIAYQQRARRTAYLVTQDPALAEDVTQSAFLRAYESIAQFDANRPFAPWFFRIVVNMAVQAANKQSREQSLQTLEDAESSADGLTFADLLTDAAPSPETEVEKREMENHVRRILAQLPPDQRAAIVLRYYVDLTEQQMADVLAVPPGTVKSRLHAARRQLRRLFELA